MKNLIYNAVLVISFFVMSSFSAEPEKIEFKKAFVKSCLEELTDIDAKIAKEYCNCAANKLITDFSIDELLEIALKMENAEVSEDELEKYLKDCIDAMEKQLEQAEK